MYLIPRYTWCWLYHNYLGYAVLRFLSCLFQPHYISHQSVCVIRCLLMVCVVRDILYNLFSFYIFSQELMAIMPILIRSIIPIGIIYLLPFLFLFIFSNSITIANNKIGIIIAQNGYKPQVKKVSIIYHLRMFRCSSLRL